MNYGYAISWLGAALSLGAAIGYACAHDWRKALYFFFAFCITATVIWK